MSPYLTRKCTSLVADPQGLQLRSKASVTKVISETKSVTNKESKTKGSSKVTSKRSIIKSKNVPTKKQVDVSTETDRDVTEEEDKKITKRKVLGKRINKKISVETRKVMTCNGSNTNKRESKDVKRKKISRKMNKNNSSSHQMSLKESFLNQVQTKCLRSRQIVKYDKKDSALINEKLSPKSQNSIVLLEKTITKKKKVPIYECVSPENSAKNVSEVYEFKFDINDSKEKLPKKRKKRPTIKKTLMTKKKKNISEKHNVQKTEAHKEEPTNVESEVIKKENVVKALQNPLKNDSEKNLKNKVESNKEQSVQLVLPENTNVEKTADNKIAKPEIVSVENLNNKIITVVDNSQISNSEGFKPFRPTNVFNDKYILQHKNMLNYSLFEKSLSPIVKSSENLDVNSPWRAPPLFTFSQVKNVFQSTPQNKKYEISSKKLSRVSSNESKNYGSVTKVKDILQKNNENVSIERYVDTNNSKKKNRSISRKFGTEITNIDHSVQSNLGEEINERVTIEVENMQTSFQPINVINSNINNTSKFDAENKENSVLNYQSPKKVLKKRIMKVEALTPQKTAVNAQNYEQKENLDPQPGPSGLQKYVGFNEQRVLKQSNLNNFLNIMEMPQSTAIKTPHGIFDDTNSTPVSSKVIRKPNEPNMELQNAFGFDDDDSNQDISPIEHEITSDKKTEVKIVATNVEKPFARISVDEIKNQFLIKKPIEDVRNKENVENEKTELKKSPIKAKQNLQIDIANFSDTFDVLSEMSETPAVRTSDVPLFMDLEPSHFTQPPRHSYKRKRAVRFSFSEESNTGEEENLPEHEAKRKKTYKKKKGPDKRLIEWVENINKTFSEVDQHELVVE